MMQMKKHIFANIRNIVLLFFVAQIVVGVLWMKNRMGMEQSMPVMERGGLFYMAILPVLKAVSKGFFLLQVILAGFAYDFLFQSLWPVSVPMRSVRVLAVITSQSLVFAYNTLTPYSIATSILVFQLGLWSVEKNKSSISWKTALISALLLLFQAFWLPEYAIFGVLPLGALLWVVTKNRTLMNRSILIVAAAAGSLILAIVGGMVSDSEDMKSATYRALARSSQLHIAQSVGYYPMEVQDVVSREDFGQVAENPERLEELVYGPVVEAYGKKVGESYLKTVIEANREAYGNETKQEILQDMEAYCLTPIMVLYKLSGHGSPSRVKRLQEYVLLPNPKVGNLLTWLSAIAFAVGFIYLVGYLLVGMIKKKRSLSHINFVIFGAIGIAVFQILWYTFQGGGVMDYRKNLLLTAMWIASAVSCLGRKDEKIEEE